VGTGTTIADGDIATTGEDGDQARVRKRLIRIQRCSDALDD
jgi:hypothetical protein